MGRLQQQHEAEGVESVVLRHALWIRTPSAVVTGTVGTDQQQ
jgi:hypothetical protein